VEKSVDKLRGFINVTRAAKAKLSQRGSITMLSGAGAMKRPQLELSVVALTNTTPEGVSGLFSVAVRDAIYRAISE
jgi:hypothetical protein